MGKKAPKGKAAKAETPRGAEVEAEVLPPKEYKKTVKLLKSSKKDRILDGCSKCGDHAFVAKSGLSPLMNLLGNSVRVRFVDPGVLCLRVPVCAHSLRVCVALTTRARRFTAFEAAAPPLTRSRCRCASAASLPNWTTH